VVVCRRLGASLLHSPGGIVAVLELRSGAVGVDVLPEGEDGPDTLAKTFAVALSRSELQEAMSTAPTSVTVVVVCPTPGAAVSTAVTLTNPRNPAPVVHAAPRETMQPLSGQNLRVSCVLDTMLASGTQPRTYT
jgi:hypothetical protein